MWSSPYKTGEESSEFKNVPEFTHSKIQAHVSLCGMPRSPVSPAFCKALSAQFIRAFLLK